MQTKILITGAKGMLGSTLQNALADAGYTHIVPTDVNEMDITNLDKVRDVLSREKPDFVINCAAYTNVEAAEDEGKELCHKINHDGARHIAIVCNEIDSKLIHISTDYVFTTNNPAGNNEDDDPGFDQINEYGKSKRLGEAAVREAEGDSYVLRVSWSFGPGGKNFIDTILRLADEREGITMVNDEHGVPCYTVDMSKHILYVIENVETLEPGYYHAVNEGHCSRLELARAILDISGNKLKLNPITLADYPRKARISNYLIMNNTKLPKVRHWREAVEAYIRSK